MSMNVNDNIRFRKGPKLLRFACSSSAVNNVWNYCYGHMCCGDYCYGHMCCGDYGSKNLDS